PVEAVPVSPVPAGAVTGPPGRTPPRTGGQPPPEYRPGDTADPASTTSPPPRPLIFGPAPDSGRPPENPPSTYRHSPSPSRNSGSRDAASIIPRLKPKPPHSVAGPTGHSADLHAHPPPFRRATAPDGRLSPLTRQSLPS